MSRDKSGENVYRRKKDGGRLEPQDAELVSGADATDEGPALEPGQMAQLIVDMRSGMVDRQAASAISGPLSDLAKAFAMQAEVLRGIHDTQHELQQAIKDDKKSEMMINSTQALNDTFRGVKGVQQRLLDELEQRGKRARGGRVATVLVALLVVVVAVAGFVWFDRRIEERGGKLDGDLARMRDEILPSYRRRAEQAEGERDEARTELTRLRADLEATREAAAEARGDDRAAGAELESLRRERASWLEEKGRLDKSVEDLRSQVAYYLERFEGSEREVVRLRDEVIRKIAAGGVEELTAKAKEEANVESPIVPEEVAETIGKRQDAETTAGAAAETPKAPVIPPETVIEDVNVLLSNHRGSQVYRLESVAAVGDGCLEDVVFTESAPGQGVMKKIRAERLEIVISGRGDLVEFNFKKGAVQQKRPNAAMGDWAPFYNDRYRMTVYCLNGQQWLGRSYAFFYVD
ncbi:MAG: hypothetical protein H6807_12570 [Planctomycetes bacterium]|nr:hypothetical protein [Planctomycetota bacterium]